LVHALSQATEHSPVPVEVTGAEGLRQPPSVEAAVYFCVLEAVQNATKHAGATRIAVQLRATGSELTLQVSDDGRGMPGAAVEGAGLTNIRERVAALGGEVSVASPTGRGTRITASVPLATAAGVG
jgi:signal transduction histidine kinase